MSIVDSLFKITEHALGLRRETKARELYEEVVSLRKTYYAEQNKQENIRNHAVMDNCVNRLCIVSKTYTEFGEQVAQD